MRHVTIHKLDPQGEIAVTYEGDLAERLPDGVRIEARWTRKTLPLGYTTFETGDHFIEWYFTDRWYNIFEIHAATGSLKGWYCNVAEPATITRDAISCRDLYLDVWVDPSGAARVLDEDEFEQDSYLDASVRRHAREAVDELLTMVARRTYPFHIIR